VGFVVVYNQLKNGFIGDTTACVFGDIDCKCGGPGSDLAEAKS